MAKAGSELYCEEIESIDTLQELKNWENHIDKQVEVSENPEGKVNDFECAEFLVNKIEKCTDEFKEEFYRLMSKVHFSYEQKIQILGSFDGFDLDKLDRRMILEIAERDFDLLPNFYSKEKLSEIFLEEKIKECEMVERTDQVSGMPLLNAQEEKILARRLREGDEEAKEILVKANLRLVKSISQEFGNSILSQEDLFQEGYIGLQKAIERFDSDLGYRFSTYAVWWIRQATSRASKAISRGVNIPEYMHRLIKEYKDNIRVLEGSLGHVPSKEQVFRNMDMSREKFDIVSQIVDEQSIMEPVSMSDRLKYDQEAVIGDFVTDTEAKSPEEEAISHLLSEEFHKVLDTLTHREKYVLECRYLIDEKMTLSEIGKELGISRERVRQVEIKALQKFKEGYGVKKIEEIS